jgi:3-oxoacyl-[acyl-carrier protein] reductase
LSEWSGGLEVLINSAGMTSVCKPPWRKALTDTEDVTCHATIERNLTSAFYLTRAVISLMLAAGYGRVVHIASASGSLVAYQGDAAYQAAKAGPVGLTRAASVEVGERG